MLVALTPFEALCGFRDPAESAEALAAFGVPALAPVVDGVAGRAGGAADGGTDAARLAGRASATGCWRAVLAASADGPDADLARRLATAYPADPGVLVALLLHHVRLAPGEAIWMPAGNLHAYLSGCGVEIMAASDNVLRGGLTPKRVDVDELLRVLRFEVLDDPVRAAQPVGPGVDCWPVPVDDFALHRVRVGGGGAGGHAAAARSPGGALRWRVDHGGRRGRRGDARVRRRRRSARRPARPLRVSGAGEAYVATSGLR